MQAGVLKHYSLQLTDMMYGLLKKWSGISVTLYNVTHILQFPSICKCTYSVHVSVVCFLIK